MGYSFSDGVHKLPGHYESASRNTRSNGLDDILILCLVYVFVFPYLLMIQLEAYILVTDTKNNLEDEVN